MIAYDFRLFRTGFGFVIGDCIGCTFGTCVAVSLFSWCWRLGFPDWCAWFAIVVMSVVVSCCFGLRCALFVG